MHRPRRPARRFALTVATALALSLGVAASLPATALADGVAVDAATPDQKLEAKTSFEVAVKLFGKDNWSEALTSFTQSHGVVASPNASFMIARCLDKLDRPAEAYNALIDVDAEAKGIEKYKQTQQQATDLRTELAKKVAILKVTLAAPPPTGVVTMTIKGVAVPLGREHAITPGAYDVVVLVDGVANTTQQGTAAAGEVKPLAVEVAQKPAPTTPVVPVPTPLPPNPLPYQPPVKKDPGSSGGTGFFIGAAVLGAIGVGGFAVGIPFGLFAQDSKDELDSTCPSFKCGISESALEDKKSTIDQQALVATIGFIAGGVGIAGAATLVIVGATRSGKSSAQPSVGVLIGPGSVGLEGSF